MRRATLGIVRDIFIAFVLAIFIRAFAVQAYKIPSGSMIPTLLVGDYILVNRLSYGLRIPYYKYILRWGEIKRGDIIVFVFPEDPSKDFIKRVIALPGETIEIRKKKIYINGREIEDKWGFFSDDYVGPPRDDFGPFQVPQGHVFVMGDNRDESNDSRFWGPVNIENIKGKAFIIYFSWDPYEKSIRFSRIFSIIR
ncbi:MAG: signal peptidase I [Candidatus Calescibacterium sp.]|jgi:signal peptidase I|nr:signal peptidase I [Candidatus Calescibacterium sp.]